MDNDLITVGENHVIRISSIAAAHWEEDALYVHFHGGRFLVLKHPDADQLWELIKPEQNATN